MTGISRLWVDDFRVANILPLQISPVANATPMELEASPRLLLDVKR